MNQDRNNLIMEWRSMQRIREIQLMRELNDEWRARQSELLLVLGSVDHVH